MQRALVLLNGGVGSAVAAAVARQEYDLCALMVDIQHRAAEAEKSRFAVLCDHYEIDSRWIAQLSHFKQVGGHPLFDSDMSLPAAAAEGHVRAVPMLMSALLDVAASFAVRVEAARIVIGACEQGAQIPGQSFEPIADHRREFFMAYQYMVDSALSGSDALVIDTPLVDYEPVEIIKLGQRLGVPFDKTWSCLTAGPTPCNRCHGCAARASAFLGAGVVDPVVLSKV